MALTKKELIQRIKDHSGPVVAARVVYSAEIEPLPDDSEITLDRIDQWAFDRVRYTGEQELADQSRAISDGDLHLVYTIVRSGNSRQQTERLRLDGSLTNQEALIIWLKNQVQRAIDAWNRCCEPKDTMRVAWGASDREFEELCRKEALSPEEELSKKYEQEAGVLRFQERDYQLILIKDIGSGNRLDVVLDLASAQVLPLDAMNLYNVLSDCHGMAKPRIAPDPGPVSQILVDGVRGSLAVEGMTLAALHSVLVQLWASATRVHDLLAKGVGLNYWEKDKSKRSLGRLRNTSRSGGKSRSGGSAPALVPGDRSA